MSQIGVSDASDLLKKLFDERTPVAAFFATPSRARIRLNGFVVDVTEGLSVGDSLPPATPSNWITVFPYAEGECVFDYGERREMTASPQPRQLCWTT